MTSLSQVRYARPNLRALHWCGLALLGYASASLFWSAEPNKSALAWLLYLGAFFCLGYAFSTLRYIYLFLIAFLTANVIVAITQALGWNLIPFATEYPAGFL